MTSLSPILDDKIISLRIATKKYVCIFFFKLITEPTNILATRHRVGYRPDQYPWPLPLGSLAANWVPSSVSAAGTTFRSQFQLTGDPIIVAVIPIVIAVASSTHRYPSRCRLVIDCRRHRQNSLAFGLNSGWSPPLSSPTIPTSSPCHCLSILTTVWPWGCRRAFSRAHFGQL